MLREDSDVGMIAFVGEERSYTGSSAGRVVVCEFGKRKDFQPIVLLVVAENAKVLLQSLIETFGLSITFQVIT